MNVIQPMNVIQKVLEQHFDQPLEYKTDLFEQGMTSLSVLRLIELVNRELDTTVDIEAFLVQPTLQRLGQLVQLGTALHETRLAGPERSEPQNSTAHQPVSIASATDLDHWLSQHPITESLSDELDLFEQGVTSLELLQVVEDLRRQHDMSIDLEAPLERPTLQRLKQLVLRTDPVALSSQAPLPQSPSTSTIEVSAANNGPETKVRSGLLLTDEEKAEFVAKQRQLRAFPEDFPRVVCSTISDEEFSQRYGRRRSNRRFGPTAPTLEQVTGWLKVLNSATIEGKPRLLYPSAGATYSVQVYVEVKPGGVQGLDSGMYYLHPAERSLIRLTNQCVPRTAHFFYNRDYYDAAHFCVYLIAEFDAIEPLYREQSQTFVAVEAGCIAQLLTQEQAAYGIGSCLLAGVNGEQLALLLNLNPSHRLMLSMVCGSPESCAHNDTSTSSSQHAHDAQMQEASQSEESVQQAYPLSENQLGLWSLQQTHPDMAAYNCPALLKIDSAINQATLHQTCQWFVSQHPIFCTRFEPNTGQPQQRIDPACVPEFAVEDVYGYSREQVLAKARALAKQPFDLVQGPLLRIYLLIESIRKQWLLLVTHHIVCDGNSFKTLICDFLGIYRTLSVGRIPEKEPLLPVYSDFVRQEQQFLQSTDAQDRLQYWQHKLSDCGLAQGLATDLPRPAAVTFAGDKHSQVVDGEVRQKIGEFLTRHKITAPTLFLAIFKLLLRTHLCTDRIVVGIATAGRAPVFRDHLGYFANMVPICSELKPEMTRLEFLRQMQQEVIRSVSKAYPFSALVKKLRIPPSTSSYPIFSHSFVFQEYETYGATRELLHSFHPGLNVSLVGEIQQQGEYELVLEVVQRDTLYELNLKFNPDLFYRSTIERMIAQYQQLLNQLVLAGEFSLSEYHCLSDADRAMLMSWNQTEHLYEQPHVLHRIIEQQVKAHPDLPAVTIYDQTLSYRQLFEQSTLLAAYMQCKGVKRGDLVGVCMYRSLELVVSLLGVLRAGAAYVPIDPDLPPERIQFIVDDSNAILVLCQDNSEHLLSGFEVLSVTGELFEQWARSDSLQFIEPDVNPDDPVYMIYTSGSTGKPKGCLLSHRAVCNRIFWMQDEFALTTDDTVLQKTPFSFDVSVWEFFWPLMVGARMVLAKPGGHKLPQYLADLMVEREITVCHFVPSMLNAFVESYHKTDKLPLRYLFTSGEALTYAQLIKAQGITTAIIANLYGPTEAAIDVSYWRSEDRKDQKVPIGKPIANVQLHVLNEQLKTCPVGVPGQLFIGGVCLAEGYMNREELTAERFIQHPHIKGRLYKTGDLARWLPDGNIEYLGRIDNQVKVRGFRIEMGEIEHQLTAHPEVTNAVVTVVEAGGEKLLAAYYTQKDTSGLTPKTLREHVAATLPDYMVPSYFVPMGQIPTNYSGKADRKKLPDPRKVKSSGETTRPTNNTERTLVSLWQETLGLDDVSTTQSFFELGGNSLSAVMMLLQVNKQFPQSEVSQVQFYQQPTIQALAKQIAARTRQAPVSHLLRRLSPDRISKPAVTLVCCPYAGASVSVFQPLADQLSSIRADMDVTGLAIPGNEVGDKVDDSLSIVELATRAANEIATTLSGPVLIYGHCVGSFLALELTHQLEMQGVDTVGLIVGGSFPFPTLFTTLPISDPWRLVSNRYLHKLIQTWGGPTQYISEDALQFMLSNFRKDAKQAFLYQKHWSHTRLLECPIIVVVSADDPLTKNFTKNYLRWEKYSQHVHLIVIDEGKHYFVSKKAHQVAQILSHIWSNADHYGADEKSVVHWQYLDHTKTKELVNETV